MLCIAKRLQDLPFSKLMEIYIEGNVENGAERYPHLSANEQLLRAEQDFYAYLRSGFYVQPGAAYYVWQEQGIYVSALRLEPYQDGWLLEALETHPDYRRQGHAKSLVLAVLETLPGEKIYSHISHRNAPSLAVHKSCGFRKISDHAHYVDGSFNDRCGTWIHE